MKRRTDLDCIGYLSDILFEPGITVVPRFAPRRPVTAELAPEGIEPVQREGKLLDFKPRPKNTNLSPLLEDVES